MMTLLRKIFWVALFLVFTLGFVTLFDHGYVTTKQFTDDAKVEAHDAIDMLRKSAMPKASPAESPK
jgi:predicted secreted protein